MNNMMTLRKFVRQVILEMMQPEPGEVQLQMPFKINGHRSYEDQRDNDHGGYEWVWSIDQSVEEALEMIPHGSEMYVYLMDQDQESCQF